MKKLISLSLLLLSFTSFSQQEFRLDIGDALVMRTVDLSYEFYLNDQSSIGVSALFNIEGKSSDFRYNEEQMFTPFFRHYFSANGSWIFFGELFMGINFGEREETINTLVISNDYRDGALGLAIGTKYVSDGGLVIDLHGGLGRNLFGSDSPALVPRIGVGVGYQF